MSAHDESTAPAAAIRRFAGFLVLAAAAGLAAVPAHAEIRITIQDSFLERYKDRVTLDATFTVDQAQAAPAEAGLGGGLRAAGRAPEIGFIAVAEVMNAAGQVEAVNLLRAAEASGRPVALRGIWRLWSSQAGDAQEVQEVQGRTPAAAGSAEPVHVFELAPLLRVGTADLGSSLRLLGSGPVREAAAAFHRYAQLASHIEPGDGVATITTRTDQPGDAGLVRFMLRVEEEPNQLLEDGLAVKAAILDGNGTVLERERRVVAATGTAPYERLRNLHKASQLRVVGLPRIDLAQVAWRLANRDSVPGVLDWTLPYEMVLVAVEDAAAPAAPGDDADDPPPVKAAARIAEPAAANRPAHPQAPVRPATPAAGTDGDVIVTLLQMLGQAAPGGLPRGACSFAVGSRTYCGVLASSQCDQLGGAWAATEPCAAPGGAPAAPAAALSAVPPG